MGPHQTLVIYFFKNHFPLFNPPDETFSHFFYIFSSEALIIIVQLKVDFFFGVLMILIMCYLYIFRFQNRKKNDDDDDER